MNVQSWSGTHLRRRNEDELTLIEIVSISSSAAIQAHHGLASNSSRKSASWDARTYGLSMTAFVQTYDIIKRIAQQIDDTEYAGELNYATDHRERIINLYSNIINVDALDRSTP